MARLEGFIEKFENDQVIIVKANGAVEWIARDQIPSGAQEGDFICQTCETGPFLIDFETTEKRRREIRRLSDSFFD